MTRRRRTLRRSRAHRLGALSTLMRVPGEGKEGGRSRFPLPHRPHLRRTDSRIKTKPKMDRGPGMCLLDHFDGDDDDYLGNITYRT